MTAPDAPSPEPGANPLDRPEVRNALFTALGHVVESWEGETPVGEEAEAQAKQDVTGAILSALASHVAAAQGAAFRQGVEAAAEVCSAYADQRERELPHAGYGTTGWQMVRALVAGARWCIDAIHALPTPAAFAAPEPDDTAGKMREVEHAIADYHYALDARQHGGVAAHRAVEAIERALGRQWVRGAEARRRSVGESAP